jgi:hypothetical protein
MAAAVLPGGSILAQKLKRGRRKKKICCRILAEFYQKVAEKGPQNKAL